MTNTGLARFLQKEFGGTPLVSGDESDRLDIEFNNLRGMDFGKFNGQTEETILGRVRDYFANKGYHPLNNSNPNFLVKKHPQREEQKDEFRIITATYSDSGDYLIITSTCE